MDVEAILNEIRNRVVADGRPNQTAAGTEGPPNDLAPQSNQGELLTRASAHLAVTGRSWDRLPPVFSSRRGPLARIELWFKKKSKPLTRWFTWEQVNFNRAVNDALCDVVEVLKAESYELASMRAQLTQEMRREFSTLRSGADEQARLLQDIEARGNQADEIIASLTDENRRGEHQLSSLQSEHSKLANQVIELAAQLREEDREITRRLSELAAELKDEQRVCFRQVSLAANESAALEDRARRALLQRLEQLEAALKAAPRG